MKIRLGFISNSSSSSFIIAFPHKPESAEDTRQMLFGKQKWHYTGHSYEDQDTDVSTHKLAENVFAKIEKKATEKEIYESIRHGCFDAYMFPEIFPGHYDDHEKMAGLSYQDPEECKKINRIWKETEKINDKRATIIAEAFGRSFCDNYIVVMEFSDNDGETIEEHSGIFERVEHIKTSYH